jgi:hypothetical protein
MLDYPILIINSRLLIKDGHFDEQGESFTRSIWSKKRSKSYLNKYAISLAYSY